MFGSFNATNVVLLLQLQLVNIDYLINFFTIFTNVIETWAT